MSSVQEDITEVFCLVLIWGMATLAKCLIETESTSKCVKLTRAQVNAYILLEEKDKLSLEASGDSTLLFSISQRNLLVKIQLILLYIHMQQKLQLCPLLPKIPLIELC